MSKVEELIKDWKDCLSRYNSNERQDQGVLIRAVLSDLEEIRTEQEELQGKIKHYQKIDSMFRYCCGKTALEVSRIIAKDGLPEQNKPVEIPRWLADWIEDKRQNHRYSDNNLIRVLWGKYHDEERGNLSCEQRRYLAANALDIARAIDNGYTVKQESKWAAKGVTDYFKYDDKIILFSSKKDAQELADLIGEYGETKEFHSYSNAEFISIEELRTEKK